MTGPPDHIRTSKAMLLAMLTSGINRKRNSSIVASVRLHYCHYCTSYDNHIDGRFAKGCHSFGVVHDSQPVSFVSCIHAAWFNIVVILFP